MALGRAFVSEGGFELVCFPERVRVGCSSILVVVPLRSQATYQYPNKNTACSVGRFQEISKPHRSAHVVAKRGPFCGQNTGHLGMN